MLRRLAEISCRQPSALALQPWVAQADTKALQFLALVLLGLFRVLTLSLQFSSYRVWIFFPTLFRKCTFEVAVITF